jgi:predicted transcriptional regulator
VKNVHGDVQALIEIGLVERKGATVRVPFDEIRAAFTLTPCRLMPEGQGMGVRMKPG